MKPLAPSQRASLEAATRAFEAALRGVDLEGRALDTGPATEVIDYLKTRGFTGETAKRFRLGAVPHGYPGFERFAGRLAIPNICASGHPVGIKFRTVDSNYDGDKKYDQPAGQVARLFNLQATNPATDLLAICEGELDTLSLVQLGIPALGVPGASAWKSRHVGLLEGFDRIVVVADADDAGRMMAKKIVDSDLPVVVVEPPHGCNDANEALRMGFGEELARMIRGGD